jgi:hypothetical protein
MRAPYLGAWSSCFIQKTKCVPPAIEAQAQGLHTTPLKLNFAPAQLSETKTKLSNHPWKWNVPTHKINCSPGYFQCMDSLVTRVGAD